jgi:hypothetical protein
MLILIIILVLLLGGGGGYYGHSRWGYGGGAGIGLGTILLILLVAYILGILHRGGDVGNRRQRQLISSMLTTSKRRGAVFVARPGLGFLLKHGDRYKLPRLP